RQNTAPSTRAVSGVSAHGQMEIAVVGAAYRNTPVATASIPTVAMIHVVTGCSRRSSAAAGRSWLRLLNQVHSTRNGVVKYSNAHSTNAALPCVNLSQWSTVDTPMSVANRQIDTNPALIVCQACAAAAR